MGEAGLEREGRLGARRADPDLCGCDRRGLHVVPPRRCMGTVRRSRPAPIGRRPDRGCAQLPTGDTAGMPTGAEATLELLDWKRRVFALYADVRASGDPEAAWRQWRETRDELFRTHPQSPLPESGRAAFTQLDYFDYDPAFRVDASLRDLDAPPLPIDASGGGTLTFRPFATASFELRRRAARAGALLARRLRRRRLPPLPRRDERTRDVRRRPVHPRYGQGCRPRRRKGLARARLQLRLQPVLLVRPRLGLPAVAAREQAAARGSPRASGSADERADSRAARAPHGDRRDRPGRCSRR